MTTFSHLQASVWAPCHLKRLSCVHTVSEVWWMTCGRRYSPCQGFSNLESPGEVSLRGRMCTGSDAIATIVPLLAREWGWGTYCYLLQHPKGSGSPADPSVGFPNGQKTLKTIVIQFCDSKPEMVCDWFFFFSFPVHGEPCKVVCGAPCSLWTLLQATVNPPPAPFSSSINVITSLPFPCPRPHL